MRWFAVICLSLLITTTGSRLRAASAATPDSAPPTRIIPLELEPAPESEGGIMVADVDNDKRPDFLITAPGQLLVYGNDGKKLWTRKTAIVVGGSSERVGLPGHNGPGVAAGDVDGDGKCEVVFLTKDQTLHIVDGASGQSEAEAKPPVPEGAERWELAMIADFRGTGRDTDLLLQATNAKGYRTGRYLAAYAVTDLLAEKPPLWSLDNFAACAHNGARIVDLDGDGRDEVISAEIRGHDGRRIVTPPLTGHADSVFAADVRSDLEGLEVVILEEGHGGKKLHDRVFLCGMSGLIWQTDFKQQEPQNAAVGRFRQGSAEMYIWCRSRYNEHQKPFVFDARGRKVFDYLMDDVAPEGWTVRGVELIHTIDWTGAKEQLACATERHESGDVCLFEPLTGKFVARFRDAADRLYVADVLGDWREEIIVLNGKNLRVYENKSKNPRPNLPRKWSDRNYRRLKQCHNYYSP